MRKKEREMLKQKRLREGGLENEKELLDLLFSEDLGLPSEREIYLAQYNAATTQEQILMIASLLNWSHTKKWAWDTLIDIVEHVPILPSILKDYFVLPALRGDLKVPSRGRPPKDERDILIAARVKVLTKYYAYSESEALKVTSKRIKISVERIHSICQKKLKKMHPFKKQ